MSRSVSEIAGPNGGSTPVVPAPWRLRGRGYVVVLRLPREFVMSSGFVPPELQGRFAGGLSTVMALDYLESSAGPYRELLFVPGLFSVPQGKLHSVTKIYVSTDASVQNGRRNWGIPKELASFDLDPVGDRQERMVVRQGERVVADLLFERGRLALPATTSILPASWATLVQPLDGQMFVTHLRAHGKARWSSLVKAHVDPELFPDFTHARPVITVELDFEMTFPVAEVSTVDHQR